VGAVNAWSPLRRNVSIESWMAKEKSVAQIVSLVHVRGASQDTTESKCIEFEMQERRRKLAYVAREDTRKNEMPSVSVIERI
jgi:hypothetical protein